MEKWDAEYRALTGSGLCDEDVEIWISHYMQMATGEASVVSDTVPRLTGHPAISLEEYLKKFPECYAHLVPK
jgi:NAD(P)H dehydrogenase (quinone)